MQHANGPHAVVRHAIVLFAHGSPDPAWRRPFDQLRAEWQAAAPDQPVSLAFLERMQPTLDSAAQALIDDGAQSLRIVPLLLAPGRHSRVDLPAMVEDLRRRWPAVSFVIDPTLLEQASVRTAVIAGHAGIGIGTVAGPAPVDDPGDAG